jgi:hypothetical protein
MSDQKSGAKYEGRNKKPEKFGTAASVPPLRNEERY